MNISNQYLQHAAKCNTAGTTEQDLARIFDGPLTEKDRPREQDDEERIVDLEFAHDIDMSAVKAICRGFKASKCVKKGMKSEKLHQPNGCPVAKDSHHPGMQELDYTTPGVQGSLQCPFSKLAKQSESDILRDLKTKSLTLPNGHSDLRNPDPIQAEHHRPDNPSPPPSVTASANKCPIRLLDQHSPEEVAEYFENHKHEIPRSHEVCVKRYQRNTESIRQLDAKYGNLVSMIQGLGVKHQAFLPTKKEDVEAEVAGNPSSAARVEQWAEDVSSKGQNAPVEDEVHEDADEERISNFERSLREVRVGESPSRPWGIRVPAAHQPPKSAVASAAASKRPETKATGSAPDPLQDPKLDDEAGRCPFGHGSNETHGDKSARREPIQESRHIKYSAPQQQLIFQGPVFFGYSPEQAMSLMQNGGFNFTHAKV